MVVPFRRVAASVSTRHFTHPNNRTPFRAKKGMTVLLLAALLGGCAVGPDYVRPAMDLPQAYKEVGPWKQATPRQVDDHQPWWQAYGDPILNDLITQANAANQTIQQAAAQYRQAQATAALARASLWPTVGLQAGAARGQTNSNGVQRLADTYTVGLNASWEADVWGRIRRGAEAGDASAQASAASLAAARLAIQATLAQDYLQLRVTDLQKDLYRRTVEAYRRSLQLTTHQYEAGTALRSDVAQAETQLRAAQAQLIDLDATRNQLEHAIAMLVGKAPAAFSLAPVAAATASDDAMDANAQRLQASLPQIPAGLPSDLLERRPDIANAERLAAAANANIGVARAAYFPTLTLSTSGGYNSPAFAQLFNTPGRVWSLGAALAETLFDGGARSARNDAATAAFDAAVAQYKQTVLGGLQEVEDNLSTLRVLDQESGVQAQAVQSAQLAERLAMRQYQAGTVTYLSVVTTQATSLTNQRNAVTLLGRQLVASVALIKATGGGWQAEAAAAAGAADAATSTPSAPPMAAR
ncbi:outer membrane channel lipoprotein [Herbaspirillum sp. BH-1]|uniref:efflux transporter outer membrane subunit n=1 Tax=Herbaspirillum sp. (strain BH-1) TaxID=2058884 RepID=UPI000CBB3D1C|nr:efflux transporter outer membrane subunit [Herbaspirillum sp. BH-1]PLY59799.1 outer membrane channel lipoprotein [Herbaspirillum sp. BH-1]